MRLGSIAATDVISVSASDSADKAIALMEEFDIHHLPVVTDEKPVGIISDRDLLRSVGWLSSIDRTDATDGEIIGPRFISDIMTTPVRTLSPDDSIEDAALLMLQEQIGAIVLVADDQLVGLVAESDILRCFTDDRMNFGSSRWRFRKVVDHMAANVFTLKPNDPVARATRLMHSKDIRHVPVVNDDHLVGVISDRDIRKACFREQIDWLKGDNHSGHTRANLRDVMSQKPLRVPPTSTLADAAARLIEARIGALPVVDHGKLCGIITEGDLLHAFLHSQDEE